MPTERQQRAADERKRKQLAIKQAQEAAKLAAHTARVEKSETIVRTRRIPGVKIAAPKPPRVQSQDRVWWSRPEMRELMRRQLAAHPKRSTPPGCPSCGGARIRPIRWMENGQSYWHCPIDYATTILATGCDYRWLWTGDPDDATARRIGDGPQSRTEAPGATKRADTTEEPSWLAERPGDDWDDIPFT